MTLLSQTVGNTLLSNTPRSPLGSQRIRRTITVAFLNLILIWAAALGTVWIRYQDEIAQWSNAARTSSLNIAAYSYQALNNGDLILKSMQDWIVEANISTEDDFRHVMGEQRFYNAMRDRIVGTPQISIAAISDRRGEIVNTTSAYPPPEIDISKREHFAALLDPKSPVLALSDLIITANTGRWTYFLARRVTSRSGVFLGVLLVGFDSEYFSSLYKDISLWSGQEISLFRTDGTLLATTIDNSDLLGKRFPDAASVRLVEQGRADGTYLVDTPKWSAPQTTGARIVAPAIVPGFPLVVSVSIDRGNYLADWRRETALTVAVALSLTALTVYLSIRFHRLAVRSEEANQARWERRLYSMLMETRSAICAVIDRKGNLVYGNELFTSLASADSSAPTILSDPTLHGADAILRYAAGENAAPLELQLRLERAGESPRFFNVTASHQTIPEIGDCVVLVGRDETKYHHVQQAIAQATKMVTLGEMATGIAHELSQPLNVIRMAAHNTLNAAARTEAAAEQDDEVVPVSDADFRHSAVAKLDRIMSQVDRAADIISRMRIFGRSSGGHGAAFDVRTPYHSALAMIGSRIRSMGIAIHEEWGEGELPLVGDQNLLEQVFLNLLVNARDALKDSPLKEKQIRVSARRTPEGRTLITIADNGPGVPAEIRERIFEPFFTAKPLGQGTGLGLALAFGIVSEAGGTLTLLPGTSGAAFQIEFPPVAGAPAAS